MSTNEELIAEARAEASGMEANGWEDVGELLTGLADALEALLPKQVQTVEEWETTTEYAYGSLDAPDIITPTGEDVDDLGTARYYAEEFWISALQRTVKRSSWVLAPIEGAESPLTPTSTQGEER